MMLAAKARSAAASRPRSNSARARIDRTPQVQHPLALAKFGQGLRREPGRTLGVAAQVSEQGVLECDRRGDVHQRAGRLASRRLERLIGSIRERTLGVIEQPIDRLKATAKQGQARLSQQQPRAGPN